jgi:hypothetical protein
VERIQQIIFQDNYCGIKPSLSKRAPTPAPEGLVSTPGLRQIILTYLLKDKHASPCCVVAILAQNAQNREF